MTRSDKILIVSTVLVTVAIWAAFNYLPAKHNELVAVVRVNGEEISRLPVNNESLSQTTISIPRGKATIEYGQGKVRVLPLNHSVCPNEICWRTGWISVPGQSIICVPNHMTITLEGATTEIDSIVR